MVIEMHDDTPERFKEAMRWVQTHRTIYGRFVITHNGLVVAILHYMKD